MVYFLKQILVLLLALPDTFSPTPNQKGRAYIFG